MKRTSLALTLALLAFSPSAWALDAQTQTNGRFDGSAGNTATAEDVEAIGDVNGDGIGDMCDGRNGGNPTYVVFGTTPFGTFTAGTFAGLGRGFRITNTSSADCAAIPDMNGDGLEEIGVSRSGATQMAVIFGKAGTADVNSAAPGAGGFLLTNAGNSPSIDGAGDVNGDGRGDLIVGNVEGDTCTRTNNGTGTVVFGQTGNTTVDLTNPGATVGGFQICGAANTDQIGGEVAGGQDVNGDGRDDVVVGASQIDFGGTDAGGAYVVFGKTGNVDVDTNAAAFSSTPQGFRIDGDRNSDQGPRGLAMTSDMNGDGRGEVGFSTDFWDGPANNQTSTGGAWAVFGKATGSNVDLGALGAAGFVTSSNPGTSTEQFGRSIAGGGDFNNDGLGDFVVGALHSEYNGVTDSGSGTLVGKSSTTPVDVDASTAGGSLPPSVQVNGSTNDDQIGRSVGLGDVTGDLSDDLLVGSIQTDYSVANGGSAYVLNGVAPVIPSAAGGGDPGGAQPGGGGGGGTTAATDPKVSTGGAVKLTLNKDGSVTVDTGIDAVCPAGATGNCTGNGTITGTAIASSSAKKKKAKPITLGKATLSVAKGQTSRVKIKLSKGTVKKLRKSRKGYKATIKVTLKTPAGKSATASRSKTIKAPKAKKK